MYTVNEPQLQVKLNKEKLRIQHVMHDHCCKPIVGILFTPWNEHRSINSVIKLWSWKTGHSWVVFLSVLTNLTLINLTSNLAKFFRGKSVFGWANYLFTLLLVRYLLPITSIFHKDNYITWSGNLLLFLERTKISKLVTWRYPLKKVSQKIS